jgi:hypothetical protein
LEGGDRRHRPESEWVVDEPDRAQPDGRGGSVKLPPRSPNLNAHAQRFVRTIKESCLGRMIWFGEGAVRQATAEFIAHYRTERNHQGLTNALICTDPANAVIEGKVHRHKRLGRLLNY